MRVANTFVYSFVEQQHLTKTNFYLCEKQMRVAKTFVYSFVEQQHITKTFFYLREKQMRVVNNLRLLVRLTAATHQNLSLV